MTSKEYEIRNIQRQGDLIKKAIENPPQTQIEKDLFNLKYMLYGIKHGSRYFRYGFVSTLTRAIKRLEEADHGEKEKAQAPQLQAPLSPSTPASGQHPHAENSGD